VSAGAQAPVTVHRWTPLSRAFTGGMVGLALLLALLPFAFAQNTTEKLTELFVLVILAAMWNALAGFGGMVSIGQQAFIGIGAYAAIVYAEHGVNGYAAVGLAALTAGVIALPTMLLVFRLRGGQFAIAMWVVAEVFRLIVTNDQSIGGGTGRSLTTLNVYDPANRQAYTYWVALAFMVLLVGAGFFLLRSRLGLSLQAIRDDEIAATSLGVRVRNAKAVLFVLAAVGCGAAGALTLANTLRVQPDSIFGIQWTAYMIFMVLVGGLGTFEGPLIGALLLFGIQQEFQDQGAWYLVGLGTTAVLFTLLLPRGIWGEIVNRYGIRLMPVGYHVRGPRRSKSDQASDGPGRPGVEAPAAGAQATETP
jgi:branched-chain amino acid transport system permease protein